MERSTRGARRRGPGGGVWLGLVAALFGLAAGEAWALSAAEIYRNAADSVVLVFGFEKTGKGSSGSGSIITRDGLVLTNSHVVTNEKTGRLFPTLVVYFKPTPISGDDRKDLRTPHSVEVVARDPQLDLALLRVKDAPARLRPIEIGDSEEVEIGESVAAIGHPGGGGLWTLTTGTISSRRRDQARDIFQTDAAINPGNSGGPLLDEHGRMVGVNTFVRRVNAEGLPLEGLNYSLRSSLALTWMQRQGFRDLAAVSRAGGRAPAAATETSPAVPDRPPAAPPARRPSGSSPSVPTHEPESPPTPRALPDSSPPVEHPAPEPRARAFEGPDGESMYGVPNPDIDLDEALLRARERYREVIDRADESVREMESRFDDYDNF
jgi:serine protease Do